MKKLYAKLNDRFEVVDTSKDETLEYNHLLVENHTWKPSDWTENGVNYIISDRLAELFNELCNSTGMKKKELAKICGKTPITFSKYCNGIIPVPKLILEKVKEFERKDMR